jgi:preprotein translocase subunit Sss1
VPELIEPEPASAEASAWPFTGLQPTVVPEKTVVPEETVEQLPSWTPPAWASSSPVVEETLEAEQPVLRETYTPPAGHWSRQADLDDENDVFENTLSREVGGSNVSTTTSALILPNIPQANDFGSLINGTGEILITGTIDLPQSLGTMGGDSRRYDDSSVDHMFDAFDGEVVSNDSAPVRAIRAVSTHTSSRGVIQTVKPQSNRVLMTAGIIAVGLLAVGVVGLLAVYIISGMG